jgi:hypothetical protein
VETGSGAIDLTGLTFVVTNPVNPTYAIITPIFASLGIGPTGMPNQSLYSGISGPRISEPGEKRMFLVAHEIQ